MNTPHTDTRPANFVLTKSEGNQRLYRIDEDSTVVIDAATRNRNVSTGRVYAEVLRVESIGCLWGINEHGERDIVNREAELVHWHTTTKGESNHGNSYTRRVFDTQKEAEQHIRKWATRRWRVQA
jgi:hypothetical protein